MTARYKMLARDINAATVQYRTWVVNNEPDLQAQHYTGLKAGEYPFVDISATDILDGYAIVDFNDPNPLEWATTKRILPHEICDSQLATLDGYDGYVYLFGSRISDKIYRAPLSNPTEWVDTNATLPSKLFGSQLAVLDGYIYLFGGDDGYGPKDTIYRAPASNPLSWTNLGSLLTDKLSFSQLLIVNDNIYLYGGKTTSGPTDKIYSASTSTPLVWSNVDNLPFKLHSSHVGIVGNFIYLFGGIDGYGNKTSNILQTTKVSATSFGLMGSMPYRVSNGQFFTIGNIGYLIAPANATDTLTKILSCNLTDPLTWTDTGRHIPGDVANSQLAVIYDRVYLFGGNGSNIIFATTPIVKWDLTNTTLIDYGHVTRTLFKGALNKHDLFGVIGFPPWHTDYKN